MTGSNRGVLYPARLPAFHRLPAPSEVTHLVRWFWSARWDLPRGRTARQHLVAFPACNLVVEDTMVGVAGPTTRASYRDLTGRGWVVAALLRPAAALALLEPAGHLDRYTSYEAPDLHEQVTAAMTGAGPDQVRRERATAIVSRWLADRVPTVDDDGTLANAMADLIDSHPHILRVQDAAGALGVSVRTLQRVAKKYVGVSPAAMIRRRRLQEAAEQVRNDPRLSLAEIAADLGYADHAHLTADFRTTLGFTPTRYREQLGDH